MKRRTRVVLMLLVATATGVLAVTVNLVRTSQGLNRARATDSMARVLSADAVVQSVSLSHELRSLKARAAMLEDQAHRGATDSPVGTAALDRAARELGLVVSRLDLDPTGGTVAMALSGPPADIIGWLQIVDQTMVHPGAALELLEISPVSQGQLRAEIRVRLIPDDGMPSGYSATRVLEADAWPIPTAETFAAAFVRTPLTLPVQAAGTARGTLTQADEPPAGELRSAPAANGIRDLRFLGIASVGGITHYAFQFGTAETVRTLVPGDQAFGWRLVSATNATLTFEKEGERFDFPK